MVLQRVGSATFSKDVLYIGSAIPLETSQGLEAVQMPLRHRYPLNDEGTLQGMMSTLTILPSGIQLRFKEDSKQVVLFPYASLNLCAAVRCIKVRNETTNQKVPRFVSLTSPEASEAENIDKPAIFTAITRRTKGRQVLECHGFITMHPNDALELVRWVTNYDKKSKQLESQFGNGTLTNGSNFETSGTAHADQSFRTDTGSVSDHPIQFMPSDSVQTPPPAAYDAPPKAGYFYTTKSAHVRRFSLQKFGPERPVTENGHGTTNGHVSSNGPVLANGTGINGAAAAGETIVHEIEQENLGATQTHTSGRRGEHFEKRYAGSTVSAPAHYIQNRPRQSFMVPMQPHHPHPMMMRPNHPHPMMMRPVLMRPPPPHPVAYGYGRQRFFSPPPGPPRVHPVPVLIPGPPPPHPGYFMRPPRRGSKGSSSNRSSSSGSPRRHVNGKPKKNGVEDSGSDVSRPATPPTDYDMPTGHRMSRKDEHYMRQNYGHRYNGVSPRRGHSKSARPPPHGYYMMPSYYPPPPGYVRARSVPPYGASRSLNRQDKKSKKSKKKSNKKNKENKKSFRDVHNESSDSVGYTSEFGVTNGGGGPRDFRRAENQFQHERAFSKSLAEETRKSTRGQTDFNAYNLNAVPNEHDHMW